MKMWKAFVWGTSQILPRIKCTNPPLSELHHTPGSSTNHPRERTSFTGYTIMGRYARSRTHKGHKAFSKSTRTRRRKRDLDQIHKDLAALPAAHPATVQESPIDEEMTGGGRFPCVHCARHFIDKHALEKHLVSKLHKKRVRVLERDAPYSVKEAEAAGGLGTYHYRRRQ